MPLHELDSREGNGLSVALFWSDGDSTVTLRVADAGFPTWTVNVPRERASDAFAHPFCYAPAEVFAMQRAEAIDA
jgi:hypothetical protein